jgi:hypothetical protein
MADLEHIAKLEDVIKEMGSAHQAFAENSITEELLQIINRPGFTTPAEALFVEGACTAILTNTKALHEMHQLLLRGARKVNSGGVS